MFIEKNQNITGCTVQYFLFFLVIFKYTFSIISSYCNLVLLSRLYAVLAEGTILFVVSSTLMLFLCVEHYPLARHSFF